MANVIKHKRGSGSDPSASNLVVGELAIRTDTGKLFTKMDSGALAEIAGGGSDIAINTLSSSSATGGGSATFNGSAYRFTLSSPPSVSAQQLLVSINGVIQKPVAGTGQPSEGFSVDGNDIILGDAPAAGSDFFILTFRSLGVSVPADNSVTSAKIADGTIVGTDLATNVDLVDNQKIRFGTGNDLHIFHDGFNSYIDDNGTGELQFRTINGSNINLIGGSDFLAKFIKDGAVELYYDNSKKLETYNGGVEVFGDLSLGDNRVLNVGTGSDLQIYHDGTNSFIKDTAGASFSIAATESIAIKTNNTEFAIACNKNGSVELYHDNSKKFETTTAGIDVDGSITCDDIITAGALLHEGDTNTLVHFTANDEISLKTNGSTRLKVNNNGADVTGHIELSGHLDMADNGQIKLGAGDDLLIYHDGTTNIITSMNGNFIIQSAAATDGLKILQNGAVELYHNGSKRFETTSSGVHLSTGTSGDCELIIEADTDNNDENDNPRIVFRQDGGQEQAMVGKGNNELILANGVPSPGGGILFKTSTTVGYTNATSRMYINGDGNVGIGTTSPTRILDVANTGRHSVSTCFIHADGANNVRVLGLQSDRTSLATADMIHFFDHNGSVVGSITSTTSSTSFNTSSDYRLKENATLITDGITRLKTLKPYRFNWKNDSTTTVDGFFAHEVTAVPEAISGTKDQIATADDANDMLKEGDPIYQQIDQSKLVPLLVAALQEAITRIEALEAA